MSLSNSSTIKNTPTSTYNAKKTNNENNKSNDKQLLKSINNESKRMSSLVHQKIPPSVKSVSFSIDTNFSKNHKLIKIDPKTGESRIIKTINSCMLTKKELKKQELIKSKSTIIDWIKTIVFYIFLYALYFIFAWIIFCIFKPSQIRYPTIYGESSFHGYEPQLIVTPMAKDPMGMGEVIRFDSSNPTTYEMYIKKINKFLNSFQDTTYSKSCKLGDGNKNFHNNLSDEGYFCLNEENLTNILTDCTKDHDFGFKYGNPCFILSLNNHLNWLPGNLNESYVEKNNLGYIDTNHHIPITCHDINNSIKIRYGNKNGINKKFYPYLNIKGFHKGYQLIQIYDLIPNQEYTFICTAHTGNDHKKFGGKRNEVKIKVVRNQ